VTYAHIFYRYLKSKYVEAPIEGLTRILPDAPPDDGMFVVDTSELFAAIEGEGNREKKSLERICRLLDVHTVYLHNAGNDAEVGAKQSNFLTVTADHHGLQYTMRALAAMAGGEPLDMQRERRWKTLDEEGRSSGLKVNWKPWEEDSDYSDTEGVLKGTGENGTAPPEEEEVEYEPPLGALQFVPVHA
jgi:DNA polymerase III epsilon subunit-like protein